MTNNTRTWAAWLLLGALVVFTGCGPNVSSPSAPVVNQQQAPVDNQSQVPPQAQAKVEFPPDAQASTARNFYFVFDDSGSMQGDKVEQAKTAVRQALATVPDDGLNLGLAHFSLGSGHELVPLGPNNRARFLAAIDGIDAGGYTPLTETIAIALERLVEQYKKQCGYGEYRIVVVTDGEATGRSIDDTPLLLDEARKVVPSISLTSIGYQLGSEHALKKYSNRYSEANDGAQLQAALSAELAESTDFSVTDFAPVDVTPTSK
ncbi:MAG: vWA domain-containing protein [Candidatus Paceibacterota bacterium]|jgi:uncharacterized protein YegL